MMAKLLDENHAVNPSKRAREQGYCIRFRLQLNEKLTNDGERYCVLERVVSLIFFLFFSSCSIIHYFIAARMLYDEFGFF